MIIASYDDLEQRWPGMQYPGGAQANGPCPFCPPDHNTISLYGVDFTGTDRFRVRPHALQQGGNCRVCHDEGRGERGTGWWSWNSIQNKLGVTASETLPPPQEREHKEIFNLWTTKQVEEAHKHVDYDFWPWPRDIVDRFNLGFGDIYVMRLGPGHLIPMQPRKIGADSPTAGWYMSSRVKGRKVKNPGSNKGYYWLVGEGDTVVITESEKNVITAIALGYPAAVATYGTGNVHPQMMEDLWGLGFRHCILMGDTGAKHFNYQLAVQARMNKYDSIRELDWQGDLPDNYDITDLYKDKGDATRALIDSWLIDSILDTPTDEPMDIRDIDEIRGNSPSSTKGELLQFYEHYQKNQMLVLALPAGAGKTHALKEFLEGIDEELHAQKEAEFAALQSEIKELEQQSVQPDSDYEQIMINLKDRRKRLENFIWTTVAWFGQYIKQIDDLIALGIDPNKWFDYKARSPENCENFETVTALANNNHNIGNYCHTICPLKNGCKYMAQDAQRKQKGITFFRHQNLYQSEFLNQYSIVAVDENPAGIITAPLVISQEHLYPHQEVQEEQEVEYELLCQLTEAVRAAMSRNAGAGSENVVRGVQFIKLVDQQLGGKLAQMLGEIGDGAIRDFQPNYQGGDLSSIKRRAVGDLINALRRELPFYEENPNTHNDVATCIHLVNGKLEIRAAQPIKIPQKIPLIVADGTALPETLELMFNKRKAKVVRVEFQNPEVKTTVITNSDWTKGSLNQQVGAKVAKAKRQIDKIIAVSDPNNPIYISDLPIDGDFYDSKYVQEATELIQGLAEKHDKILVIGLKDLRTILELQLFQVHPDLKGKVALEHYGAIRGTNAYKDFPAILLIGAYRVPYDVLYREISMWVFLSGKDRNPIPPETVTREAKYEGHPRTYKIRTFTHPFADRYVENRERSEMLQAEARIRAHSSRGEKHIYIAAGRPFSKFITSIEDKKEFLDMIRPSKKKALYVEMKRLGELIHKHNNEIKMPSYRDFATKFNVSMRDVSKVRQKLEKEGVLPVMDINTRV